ncbi:MAG TPA: FAD-dependent oxidoreductase [Mycobacteriales bacterium]|nr:FAD-dependent oxidoreductase [Mycobacteriales bacterium]
MRTLIIGNGMAAGRLVQELVARGVDDITVVGDEPHHAYNRLLLSGVLGGIHDPRDLEMRTPGWYRRNGVAVLRGQRATGLDVQRREVRLADRTLLRYERLVLATGSHPHLPSLRGIASDRGRMRPGIFAFRTLADCEQIAAAAAPGKRAVVIGGGLLGLEAARGLSLLGCQVEIVHQAPHLMEKQLDAGGAEMLRRTLDDLGITTYLDTRATALRSGPDDRVEAVCLANRYELDCDLVVFACGIRPATRLAQEAGIAVRHGIVVDDSFATSAPQVWAIGECAEYRGSVSGWAQSAIDHATALAGVLTGAAVGNVEQCPQITRLRAAGVELAAMGDTAAVADANTEVLCLANPVARTYRKTVVRDGQLIGALLVGDVSAAGELTRAFERGRPLPADRHELLFSSPEGRVA